MGNMFLGFPVPRAKIAEMIEGSAPPLEHKENHEPDGSDPLALPEDISTDQILKWNGSKFIGSDAPAGGIATRYDDPNLFFCTNFESLDAISQLTGGGATVTLYHIYLLLDTTQSTTGYCKLYKGVSHSFPSATWDKAYKFRTTVRILSETDEKGDIYIVRGTVGNYPHLGFFINDGVLKGISRNGSAVSTVTLETLGAAAYDEERALEVAFTPATKAEFYVDGIKEGEITTNLPSGTGYANYYFYLHVLTNGNNKRLKFYISNFQSVQAA